MPITIEWGNDEKNISHIKFTGNWDWNDFYEVSQKGYEMTDSVEHKVNILLDFTESNGSLPPSAITHFKKAAEKAHPRHGVVMLVSKRMMLIKALTNVIQRVTKLSSPILFATTLAEAYTTLNHIVDNKPETIHLR